MIKYLLKLEILRSKEATFWFIIFPILLTFILSSIFGEMDRNIRFKVGVMGNSTLLENLFDELRETKQFEIKQVQNIDKLLTGELDIIVKIPKDFDFKFHKAFLLSKTTLFKPINLIIYYVSNRDDSTIARDIFYNIFSTFDIEFYKRTNNWNEVSIKVIKKTKGDISYYEFLFPSIIVMIIMSVAFFGYTNGITNFKRQGILKKIASTPYSLKRFYFSYTLVSIVQIFFSLVIFFIFESVVYHINVFDNFSNTLFYTSLGTTVFLSIGYFLANVIKNPETNVVLGNILFQVFMFAGGFYFDVKNIKIIGQISKYIPSTYIVDGIRKSFDYSQYGDHLTIPVLWITIFLFFSLIFGVKENEKI
ncbi:ABC transporter permease [Thermosipho atlanticus]|uniref:ABC-2 type transport system permease protein n=1 Tax=Thermosipho atlanticus DSM 15807 TaxID=1123380 RepID=A0A1M5RZX5_9BACT|nr:ABC transporter permease [Thermosipho atlanticus]SHH31779.1 ABC-2 type transport system permease protein [Thermosipho atlanticus DSM 15807]